MFHVTQAKLKLRQRLLNELPGRLASADAAASDGITTPAPYEIYTTDKADIGGMPSLELIVTDSTPKAFDTMAQIYRHRIAIGVSVGGDTEEETTIRVERYIWCMRQIMRDIALVPIEGTGPVETFGEQVLAVAAAPRDRGVAVRSRRVH